MQYGFDFGSFGLALFVAASIFSQICIVTVSLG
jgi:hypothetical protein